jgi:pyruvate/2-oxoglutarate/acetoin dehydrogenase E1 component
VRELTSTLAIAQALDEEMARDDSVFVMGIDVEPALYFRTKGLAAKYPGRVRDTPISELGFLGAAVGAAATGMRPVVDVSYSNFLYVGMDQLVNGAAKLRYMTGGSLSFPLTVIATSGAPGAVAAQHSESVYSQIVNVGGVKVVLPSTPEDVMGLLKSAIRDPNPVLFLVPAALGMVKGELPDEEFLTPLGKARIARPGSDVTVVAYGMMARKALSAAAILENEGVSIEIIDPRTLYPLDVEAIIASVAKTGRLVVVDEAKRSCSVGSEIVARVATDAFDALRAPPRLVANPDTHIPFASDLERRIIPQVEDIVDAVRSLAEVRV